MDVVHTTASLNIDDGGPSRSVSQLCSALNSRLDKVIILTNRWKYKEAIQVDEGVDIFFCDVKGNLSRQFFSKSQFVKQLDCINERNPISLIHNHGLWLRSGHDTVRYAATNKVPVVQSPRGMLSLWAKHHKMWKKRLAWAAYQKKDLSLVDAFHATSPEEKEAIRESGWQQPVAVIPNGVPLVDKPPSPERPETETRTLLFLSRIDVVKGIPLLLEAWARLAPKNWRLVIAGNDYGGHLIEVKKLIGTLGISDTVRYVGPAYGEEKDRLLRTANLFVLPSYSENFGIAVAEALQYGLPVIASKGTPWQALVERGCGWWVAPTVEGIMSALEDAISLSDETRGKMGAMGQQLVEEKYLWGKVAEQMSEFYLWIDGKGSKPTCVE